LCFNRHSVRACRGVIYCPESHVSTMLTSGGVH
jgi:hypothetical protein